jgi:hypothetical protein
LTPVHWGGTLRRSGHGRLEGEEEKEEVRQVRLKRSWVGLAAGVAALAIPGPAGAAIQLGQVAPADPGSVGCSGSNWVQTSTSTIPYLVPSPGVITMWSHRGDGDGSAGSGRLQAWTPAGGEFFTLAGRSELQAFTAGAAESYPTRIGVKAGDLLGMRAAGDAGCFYSAGGGNGTRSAVGFDPVPGDTVILSDPGSTILLNIAATLEQDADHDGFGDESQDCDPTDPARAEDCAAPGATITKGPRQRTRKKTATFEFTGTDARAVASFQCKVDAGAFAACVSPHTVKVKKGKHSFQVQAVDQAGNVGAPATDAWKVKKKKEKK